MHMQLNSCNKKSEANMKKQLAYSLLIAIFALLICVQVLFNRTGKYGNGEDENKTLSRIKRFIVFPDGSSFQLVFCTQNQGYLRIGDVVWFGNTAAMAWELPTDPTIFNMLKGRKKQDALRREDNKHIYYLDEQGKLLDKVPYKRKPIINPAFAKRDVNSKKIYKKHDIKVTSDVIKQLHENQKNRDYLKSHHLNQNHIEFHRNLKMELYSKMEVFLRTLGVSSRECVLRMLCESGKNNNEQTSFVEEILSAVFTLPKGVEFENENHKAYDEAYNSQEVCHLKYAKCFIPNLIN